MPSKEELSGSLIFFLSGRSWVEVSFSSLTYISVHNFLKSWGELVICQSMKFQVICPGRKDFVFSFVPPINYKKKKKLSVLFFHLPDVRRSPETGGLNAEPFWIRSWATKHTEGFRARIIPLSLFKHLTLIHMEVRPVFTHT